MEKMYNKEFIFGNSTQADDCFCRMKDHMHMKQCMWLDGSPDCLVQKVSRPVRVKYGFLKLRTKYVVEIQYIIDEKQQMLRNIQKQLQSDLASNNHVMDSNTLDIIRRAACDGDTQGIDNHIKGYGENELIKVIHALADSVRNLTDTQDVLHEHIDELEDIIERDVNRPKATALYAKIKEKGTSEFYTFKDKEPHKVVEYINKHNYELVNKQIIDHGSYYSIVLGIDNFSPQEVSSSIESEPTTYQTTVEFGFMSKEVDL